jgi:rhodanese-related sulfurtransferase
MVACGLGAKLRRKLEIPLRTQITLVAALFASLVLPACGSDENGSVSPGTDGGVRDGATAVDTAVDVPVGMDAAGDMPAAGDGGSGRGDGAVATEASGDAGDGAVAVLTDLSPQELNAALQNKDFLMIDVHYPYAGTIPGTDARIPFDDIAALVKFIGPDLDRKVVLTCLSGHMSTTAGNTLVGLGYRHISQLKGGMRAWTDAGYSLDRDGGV